MNRFFLSRKSLIAPLVVILIQVVVARAQESEKSADDAATPGWRFEFQKKYELFRDYGCDWRLGTFFELNAEDGLILGAGPILYQFGFRAYPYVSRMELIGGLSLSTARYKIVYNAFWPAFSQHVSLDLKAHVSQIEVRNFYGYGNQSPRDEQREDGGFYRVASQEYVVQAVLRYSLGGSSSVRLGVGFRDFTAREQADRILSGSQILAGSPFAGLGADRTLGSMGAAVVVDTRDHLLAPRGGVYLSAEGWNVFELFDNRSPFQKVVGEFRLYLGDTLLTDIMLAVRLHGEILNGRFPFFEAAFLGGTGSLRGFSAQRFAGDASAFGSAELRFSVGRWMIIVPTEVGLFFLGDAGRVWVDGDSPGGAHTDAGAGVWLAPLSRDTLLSFGLASSVDGVFVFGGVGFGF